MLITDKDGKTGVAIMANGNNGMRVAEQLAIKIVNAYFLESGQRLDRETFDFFL